MQTVRSYAATQLNSEVLKVSLYLSPRYFAAAESRKELLLLLSRDVLGYIVDVCKGSNTRLGQHTLLCAEMQNVVGSIFVLHTVLYAHLSLIV